ncbi:MAG: hypothetical protein H7067_00075 [Burkholderiales bacterium]|nr:hypothetical protein [Opitutaceae bacterium]
MIELHGRAGLNFTGIRGRLALRCMMRTDLTVRHFRVRNRPRFSSQPL